MESEILKAMKDDMYLSLLIQVIALITALLTIVWLCFEEIRQPARRRITPVPELLETAEEAVTITAACNSPVMR